MEIYKNEFKISARIRNDKFKLPDRTYSLSDFKDYFQYILRSHEEKTNNPSIRQ